MKEKAVIKFSHAIFWTVSILLGGCPSASFAQDLIQRAKQDLRFGVGAGTQNYQGRDRLDLAISGDLGAGLLSPPQGQASLGLNASLDADFACGKFDIHANLRSLFGKEAREEFMKGILNYALSELTGSGLTLLCEASPTACQVFQHYRVNANEMLKVNYNWCQAIQQGVDSGLQKSQAAAIKACIDEKRQQGRTMDQALQACQNSNKMLSFGGLQVINLSVLGELSRGLKLSPEDQKRASFLINDVTLTTSGVSGQIRSDVIPQAFLKRRDQYLGAWDDALSQAKDDQSIARKTLEALSPPGAPPVLPDEVKEIGRLSPTRQRLFVSQMASTSALLSLTVDIQWLERLLQASRKDPTIDQNFLKWLESELADLRRQLEQMRELATEQSRYQKALAELSEAGQRKVREDAANAFSAIDSASAGARALSEVPPLGKFASPRQGAGCTNCPTPTKSK
jgi:hypothetical protein